MQSLDFVDIINKVIVRTNETTEKLFQIERRLSCIESNLTSLNQTVTLIRSKEIPSSPSITSSPPSLPKQEGSLNGPSSIIFSLSSPFAPESPNPNIPSSPSSLPQSSVSPLMQDAVSTLASLASSSLPSLSPQTSPLLTSSNNPSSSSSLPSDSKSVKSSFTPKPVSARFIGASAFKRPIQRQREEVPYSRYPQRAVDVLMTWFNDHITDPYPTELVKNKLCQKTGLSKTQVATWFTNARRRRHLKTDAQSGRSFVTFPNVERREREREREKEKESEMDDENEEKKETTTSVESVLQKDSVSNTSLSDASAPEPSEAMN